MRHLDQTVRALWVVFGVLAAAGCETSESTPDSTAGDLLQPDIAPDAPADSQPPEDPGTWDSPEATDVPGEDSPDVGTADLPGELETEDALPTDTATELAADLATDTGEDVSPPQDQGTDGDLPGPPQEGIEIAGRWVDDWGGRHVILDGSWEMVGMAFFHILEFHNDGRWIVAQNDLRNDWSPGLFSRFDWTVTEAGLWYCQTAFAAATREEAAATPAADPTDPATGGCGGFPWTRLVPDDRERLEIAGTWQDPWGGTHRISESRWEMVGMGSFEVLEFHNDGRWIVAQNDPANQWNPGLFSRFDWTFLDQNLWYCQTAFAAASREEAAATPAADSTDPATGGCGGFPWTLLTPDGTPATADLWISAPGHTGTHFEDAYRAVNGVRGGGQNAGSTDVFSLGYREGIDNYLVLGFRGSRIRNGPGADFVVFENPFEYAPGQVFMDLVVVFLSRDGVHWVPFPHRYLAEDPAVYQPAPSLWPGFAGRTPVLYHQEDHAVDPFDPDQAGGDAFDLSDLPDEGEAGEIRRQGVAYLKLVTAPSLTNPDTGALYVRDPASNGADIDGVIARYLAPR
ncbi:MAG TPA: LIC_13355 family lipoprotein [Myxococcota bacterium]|nr:LIC_13355 family lipoprotein [Myxococcota bacterium]HQK49922.1 LIC_13355 family lipoprotein [Myxococcota bacterium]